MCPRLCALVPTFARHIRKPSEGLIANGLWCGIRTLGSRHSPDISLSLHSAADDIGHRSSISINLQPTIILGISINRCSSHSLSNVIHPTLRQRRRQPIDRPGRGGHADHTKPQGIEETTWNHLRPYGTTWGRVDNMGLRRATRDHMTEFDCLINSITAWNSTEHTDPAPLQIRSDLVPGGADATHSQWRPPPPWGRPAARGRREDRPNGGAHTAPLHWLIRGSPSTGGGAVTGGGGGVWWRRDALRRWALNAHFTGITVTCGTLGAIYRPPSAP